MRIKTYRRELKRFRGILRGNGKGLRVLEEDKEVYKRFTMRRNRII